VLIASRLRVERLASGGGGWINKKICFLRGGIFGEKETRLVGCMYWVRVTFRVTCAAQHSIYIESGHLRIEDMFPVKYILVATRQYPPLPWIPVLWQRQFEPN
jgi:hypothetical protein